MPPQAMPGTTPYLSVSPPPQGGGGGYDKNDGEWDDEWEDGSSAASDTYSGEYNFNSGPGARTASMARAGTVKKSMNRYEHRLASRRLQCSVFA